MYFSQLNLQDTINGEGNRVSLFVSGCNHACKGCWNPETWNFKNGAEYTPEIEDRIIKTLNSSSYYAGLSLLGGDPLAKRNFNTVLSLVQRVKEECKDKSIWLWTGFTHEELVLDVLRKEILQYIDVLIDGLYVEVLRDLTLPYRGSSNQNIIHIQEIK